MAAASSTESASIRPFRNCLPAISSAQTRARRWTSADAYVVAATMDEPNNFFETSSVPDPESAFNCPGASPSPPRHRRDAVPGFIPTHRSCPPQLMIKCLNNKFNRNTEQAFKKKHTGLGWGRAVNLVDTAIELQHGLGRL